MDRSEDAPQQQACSRLAQWQSLNCDKIGRHSSTSDSCVAGSDVRLQRLTLNSRTLIWLEACDTAATRSAVELASTIGATIHIGQSPGSHSLKSVMASSGWLGTTLSEVSARGDLVITLGDGIRAESPLIAERFFRATNSMRSLYWIHITQQPNVEFLPTTGRTPDEVICVPRQQWFELLTLVALNLGPRDSVVSAEATNEISRTAIQLAERLSSADYSVWAWDVDELHFTTDELIIRRMLSIAQQLSESKRCSLLPLDMNVGRVTAEETLLWLTGCSPTATFADGKWVSPTRFSDYSLEQWQQSFDSVILISSFPNLRSLPNLQCDLVLQTQSAINACDLQVAAVGLSTSGHVFRGDRGSVHYVPGRPNEVKTDDALPQATDVLKRLVEINSGKVEKVIDAN